YNRSLFKWPTNGYINLVSTINVIQKVFTLMVTNDQMWLPIAKSSFRKLVNMNSLCPNEKKQPLRKKGIGLDIHVSDFLMKMIRPLRDDLEEAHAMMILGSHHDGYCDAKKLIIQVRQAIDIFERTHPGCVGLFAFDNATAYTAFAENALLSSKINLFPSGSVSKMQDTYGMKTINQCQKGSTNQPDFLAQCSQVQQKIESRDYKMDAYRHGLMGKAAEYAVRRHKKHRTINENIMNHVDAI
ncbi:2155_t:CDS:2, partial [Cetraspora pellucida]